MDFQQWRSEFPILERVNYLNSCSLGALSRRALERIEGFHQEWHSFGASAWYETWLGRLEELRRRVGRLISATAGEVALAPSTSVALSAVASALDYRSRPRILVAELDFPTIAYVWRARPDVELVVVPSDDGVTIELERWAEAADQRTAAIATSHVFFATGAIQDVRAIAEIAHGRGALCIIDGYHGAGQIPVDVGASGCDVYTAGPLKWLLGGPGLAYLYVRRALAERVQPTVAGWFGARDQFAFDLRSFEPKQGALRFEMGTPALPTVHAALGAMDIIEEIGIPAIRERNLQLTETLIGRAAKAGMRLRLAAEPAARSAIVMVARADPAADVARLAKRRIIVDSRPGYVRISPHFYNSEDEVVGVIDALAASP
ncbi:MAG: aminotransferase class V-fold PLP-dependent enzyme [Longimicrobiales bacterium]